jgi:hypothetical protein
MKSQRRNLLAPLRVDQANNIQYKLVSVASDCEDPSGIGTLTKEQCCTYVQHCSLVKVPIPLGSTTNLVCMIYLKNLDQQRSTDTSSFKNRQSLLWISVGSFARLRLPFYEPTSICFLLQILNVFPSKYNVIRSSSRI